MRWIAVLLFAVLLWPSAAGAQDDTNKKIVKIAVGAAALTIGTVVAAKSSETTTTNNALGQTETSKFSTSQLVTGLTIAGVGGLVLWSGLKQHSSSPGLTVSVAAGRKVQALIVRRSW